MNISSMLFSTVLARLRKFYDVANRGILYLFGRVRWMRLSEVSCSLSDPMHWCLSCLHGLAMRSPRILAGGILGFGIATFLLWHQSAHPVMFFFVFLLLFPTGGLLGTWHTSCLASLLFTAAFYDASIPPFSSRWLFFICLVCLFLWLGCFCLSVCLVWLVGLFLYTSGMSSYSFSTTSTGSYYSIGFTCSN